ncbi:hypothetical protein BDD12DRAFT_914039 [Trichophaea hybrida]|nr:hypothetical protein BDD12DRAFT_914039 [Trichophaea hybrida]
MALILLGTTLLMVLVLISLFEFWSLTTHDDPLKIRSIIANLGKTNSLIAICSIILRTCMALQLGICCMMMASLAFTKECVLLQDAAAMSIWRYSANSPYSLLLPVLRGTRVSRNFSTMTLLVLVSISAMVSQVISPILLSDTDLKDIDGVYYNEDVPYRFSDDTLVSSIYIPTMGNQPVEFPAFAQKKAQYIAISDNSSSVVAGPGISDTGPTLIALLPFSTSTRTHISYYNGSAAIVDSHVLCVSPTLDKLEYSSNTSTISGKVSAPFLKTTLATGKLDQDSFRYDPKSDVSYNFSFTSCGLQLGYPNKLCPISQVPRVPEQKNLRRGDLGRWWLLANMSVSDSVDPTGDALSNLIKEKGYRFNGNEWITKSGNVTGGGEVTLNITICGISFDISYARVIIEADTHTTEPPYPRYSNFSNTNPNATNFQSDDFDILLNQLGVNTTNKQPQGIFNLTDYQITKENDTNFYPADIQWNETNTPNIPQRGISLTIYEAVFQQSLSISNKKSSVLALQSIFTILSTEMYYLFLDTFDQSDTAQYQTLHPKNLPIRHKGLYTVCGIVGFHTLIMVTVFWLYFRSSAPKFLRQAWQTVGQLYSGEAKNFLGDTHNLSDRDMGNRIPTAQWNGVVQFSEDGAIKCKEPLRTSQEKDSGQSLGKTLTDYNTTVREVS